MVTIQFLFCGMESALSPSLTLERERERERRERHADVKGRLVAKWRRGKVGDFIGEGTGRRALAEVEWADLDAVWPNFVYITW